MAKDERYYPEYRDLIDAIDRSIREERDAMKQLVNDEDSCCVARNLRAERMRTLEWMLSLLDTYRMWEW